MNPVFKCFIMGSIAVVIVSGYIEETKAMGLCGFQRKFHDKIPKASDCNCKNKTNATSASVDVVTQQGGSSKRVSYVELITSSSRDMTTTTGDTTNITSSAVDVVTQAEGSSHRLSSVELMTSSLKDLITTPDDKTNATSASVDVVTQQGGSSKRVSYVELITSSSRDMTTTTGDTTNITSSAVDVVTQAEGSSHRLSSVELMTSSLKDLITTPDGIFSTDPPCLGNMVNEPFVNENCTQRCICNSTGKLTCSNYSCGDNSTCDVEDGVRECYCNDGFIRRGRNCSKPTDCHDLYSVGTRESGIYTVYPLGWSKSSLEVYCDMGTRFKGGWTVFQRRVNGSVDFFRNWTEYKNGFGSLNHEFWLGNEALYYLTNQGSYQLEMDISSYEGKYFTVKYALFRIGNEAARYRLSELGDFQPNGLEYDALRAHVNASFSTYDRDDDLGSRENCAEINHGGWWFTHCHMCYLNGVYGEKESPGIRWYGLPGGQYNIISTEMKIRPVD